MQTIKPQTKVYQKHTSSGFGYYIKCFDESVFTKEPVVYAMQTKGEDLAL